MMQVPLLFARNCVGEQNVDTPKIKIFNVELN